MLIMSALSIIDIIKFFAVWIYDCEHRVWLNDASRTQTEALDPPS